MQKAPVMKSSGLAPIDDEPVHVFGRNLEDRVVESKPEDEAQNKLDEIEREKREQEDDVETIKKRKFETITGEEDEDTAFQGDFKLFIWDKSTSNWIEKGRGQLKLNDSVVNDEYKSRLIMRAGGTYRIILNVAIQHSFFKVIATTKTSIRFTDSQSVWAASGSNAKQLADLIADRLEIAAEQAKKDQGNGTLTGGEQVAEVARDENNTEGEWPAASDADEERESENDPETSKEQAEDESNQDQEESTGESNTDDTPKPDATETIGGDKSSEDESEDSVENTPGDGHEGPSADQKSPDCKTGEQEDKVEEEAEEQQGKSEDETDKQQHEECETKRIKLSSS